MTLKLKKAELHLHIEGGASPALALELARKYNVDTSEFILNGSYVWSDFTTFVRCYDFVAELFRSEEDFALLAETYLTSIAEAGAIYGELFVAPDQGVTAGIGADAYINAIGEGMERAKARTGIESRMVIIGVRHFGVEKVIGAAQYASRRPHPLISGFSMAGEERMGRVADYVRAFDIARDAGLGITIHAGELCGAFSVRDALDLVQPDRIGHGVRAIEDMDLVHRLADLGTVLEVCPGSNIALKVFEDFKAHPLRDFVKHGVKVTLNSDDPPFFHTSLAREYDIASSHMGFDDDAINAMTRTALEAAFVDEATRARLLTGFDAL
jgi:adenosine deaminase